jgi:hypothetical protein
MSDTRTLAIRKAATELVQELLAAGAIDGGERWVHIIERKMEGLLRVNLKDRSLRVGIYELTKFHGNVVLKRILRSRVTQPGGDDLLETDCWEPKDLAKLKLWLNGES